MGACEVMGSYCDYEYSHGINNIQAQLTEEYGTDLYNGTASTVDFGFIGDFESVRKSYRFVGEKAWREKLLSENEFIKERMKNLSKRQGEIIRCEIREYHIFTTDIVTYHFPSMRMKEMRKGVKKPAVLIKEGRFFNYVKLFEGTVADCKKMAHRLLREGLYREEMYIVSRSGVLYCSGNCKKVAKTKRTTNDRTLVVPVYRFRYYGVAAE